MCKRLTTLFLFLILVNIAIALPPSDMQARNQTLGSDILDVTSYIDANNLFMIMTNNGGLAENYATWYFNKADGLFFPYSGNCDDLVSNPHSVLYSAGLFLGGKVGGEIRMAIGAFDTPEYVQGPMSGGTYLTDNARFKIYKITNDSSQWLDPYKPDCKREDSLLHFDDYTLWQTPEVLADGAPVDGYGLPLLKGTQTNWCVFNDAAPHGYSSYGGGTNPLGVEIQRTVWASNAPDEENVIYIEYLMINKGGNNIDSFYIGFWADPDLGGASDDLVGCDTTNDIFYCYNATNNDNAYGTTPPAWGGRLIQGPIVPSSGDTAYFMGEYRLDYKNLRLSSFNKYINGTDPDTPAQSYGYMKGFDAVDQCPTCPYIDPVTGDTTRFPYAGDPVNGTGWLDSNPSDRRLLANVGPISFNPGDTQQVIYKIAVGQDVDRKLSLVNLLDILGVDTGPTPSEQPIFSLNTAILDEPGLRDVNFYGPNRWLSWVNWGGSFFGGSCDYGYNFWGGYLNPSTMPDSFSSVQIKFTDNDPSTGQRAYSYCRGCDPSYGYLDYVQVPFQAWDTDHNRQINVCFVEWIDSDVFDGTWGPDATDVGGREYLFILNSDYDGDSPSDAGTGSLNYPAMDFYDGSAFDFLYGCWFRIRNGYTIDSMATGDYFLFDYIPQFNPDSLADSVVFKDIAVGSSTYQEVRFTGISSGISRALFYLSDVNNFSISLDTLSFLYEVTEIVTINFNPQTEGDHEAILFVVDDYNSNTIKTMRLLGSADMSTDIDDEQPTILPELSALDQNYPNPFNPTTKIDFSLASRTDVSISVYNILGQKLTTLIDENLPAGSHSVTWDGTDASGNTVATGIYFYKINAGDYTETRKMILMK